MWFNGCGTLASLRRYRKTLASLRRHGRTRFFPGSFDAQKQQFCRPSDSSTSTKLDTVPEQSQAVLNEYIVNVEQGIPKFDIQSQDLCAECKEPMQLYQAFSVLICPKCGQCKEFLDATASLLAYSDDYDYCSFSYKRINHFSEWLASIQAKENLEVPDAILQTIVQELRKDRITNNDEVTVHKVREILKKQKL